MTGRERITNAFHCQDVDRVPWVPFVGCHAGALLDLSATDFLKSEDHIVAGVEAAIQRYQPDGVPIVFDLQIEAEIFGCELNWSEDNPPAVISHPLQNGTVLKDLTIPSMDQGRLPIALSATRRLREKHQDLALYGLITGPFTLALHLLGTDIFMQMFEDEEAVGELIGFAGQVGKAVADAYLDAGADVIGVVDPMTSQIGPAQFRQFITPHITPIFDHVRERDRLGSFFVCGHAQQNIEAMCECRPHNVSVDENIPLDFVRDTCLERGISFGGNMQLTTVLLLGSPDDARRNALACLDVGGTKGFVLAPGCDLPYATPPENLAVVGKLVADPYEQEIARTLATEETPKAEFDMSHYGAGDKVIVDIITLDSEACAPCQYMVESVKSIAPHFEGIVEWREHKIKYREALVFMTSLMVKNIPTICIDGQITFVSRIPSRDELIAAIQRRIFEKLRYRIRQKRVTLFVLGDGGEECQKLQSEAQAAAIELGDEAEVEMVSDPERLREFGVLPEQTPAVVIGRYQLKSTGQVPERAIIKEWLKDS